MFAKLRIRKVLGPVTVLSIALGAAPGVTPADANPAKRKTIAIGDPDEKPAIGSPDEKLRRRWQKVRRPGPIPPGPRTPTAKHKTK
jgi:hypothetical protein